MSINLRIFSRGNKAKKQLEEEQETENHTKTKVSLSVSEEEVYEVLEREIHPAKIICPDCGGITLEGLDFCDKCGGELS